MGTPTECYSVTFTDYGNTQSATHVALIVPYPESLLELAGDATNNNNSNSDSSVARDPSEDAAVDAELAELEKPRDQPPKMPSKGITGKQVIGTNADGTPQYMSIEVSFVFFVLAVAFAFAFCALADGCATCRRTRRV